MVDITDFEGNPIKNPNYKCKDRQGKIDNKEFLSYHIDTDVKRKWDRLRNNNLVKADEDRCYIIDGKERAGKSLYALQQAKYIDPNFDVNNICYTPNDFLERVRNAPQGSVIVFDEAFRGLSSKGTQSKVNKAIVEAMMEMGQRNLVVFIVLPSFFMLEKYVTIHRSTALFHVFTGKPKREGNKKPRMVRIYNGPKKAILYQQGKKKGFSYAFPKIKKKPARFYEIYPVNREEYLRKKLESLRRADNEKIIAGESRFSIERKIFLANFWVYCKNKENMTQERFCEMIKKVGVNLERSSLSGILTEVRKMGKIVES